jgi:TetR/AcrR family transcriptional regulator, repressor for uid operon
MVRKTDPVRYEEKRGEILEAAERCFARRGFHGATIAQICAEAKISPGHLYHYFETKESIIEAIVGAGLEYVTARAAQIPEDANPITAVIAEIEHFNADYKKSGPGILLDMLAEAGRDPAIGKLLQDSSASMRVLMAGLLRKGQASGQIDPHLDTDTAAAVLLSIIDSSKALSIRVPRLDAKKRAKVVSQMITRFLSPPGRTPGA